jgi:hypothetical protein
VLHEFTLHKGSPGLSVVLYQAKRHNDPLMKPLDKLEIAAKEMLEISYHYKEGVHEGITLLLLLLFVIFRALLLLLLLFIDIYLYFELSF